MIVANPEIFLPAVCACLLMNVASSEISLLRICSMPSVDDCGQFWDLPASSLCMPINACGQFWDLPAKNMFCYLVWERFWPFLCSCCKRLFVLCHVDCFHVKCFHSYKGKPVYIGWPAVFIHHICRVGQNRIYTPYMTVYLVISLPKIPYVPYIYGSGQPYVYDFLLACWAHNLLVKL